MDAYWEAFLADPYWTLFGLTGNAAFFSRFLVQWVISERRGESVVPPIFWYFSLVGSVILLFYAIHKQDPIFTLAYLPNSVVYVRNLMLVRRKEKRDALERGETG